MADLLTERLLLRRWKPEDVAPYAVVCADPDVMRHIGDGSVLSRDQAAGQIERFEDHWEQHGYGLWAVESRHGGEFIGFAGLSQPLFLPEVLPAVEVGWRFAKSFWGNGYATETGAAALRFGFDEIGLDRIIGIASEANPASWTVMTKLGMTLERRTTHPQFDVALVVYEVAAPGPS